MSLPPIATALSLDRSISQSRDILGDLQRQLATQKKHTSYGGVGLERSRLLSVRSELLQVEGYKASIAQVDVRLDVMLLSLTRVSDLTSQTRSDALSASFERGAGNQTGYQVESLARLDEMVTLMNTQVAGRFLFAGREGNTEPVVSAQEMMDGSGARAGFTQIVDERRQADMGGDGLGRLDIPAAVLGVASIAEDAVGSPFGFKLAGVNASLTGTTVTGPVGAPAEIEVTFSATLPEDGETVTIALLLPDGTETDITLTARAGPATAPGEFSIGADEDATAVNFQAALETAVEDEAEVTLRTASLFAAANNFFDIDPSTPPQRVDGPPFDTATSLRDGTAADTVQWYQGEVSNTPARESAIGKADDSIFVSYGARANEDGLAAIFKQLAVISVETFEGDPEVAGARYEEMRGRVVSELGFSDGAESPNSILTELSTSKTTLGRATSRHEASANLLQSFVDTTENADLNEVGAQILSLQTRLEASLQVTALLARTTLVNYL